MPITSSEKVNPEINVKGTISEPNTLPVAASAELSASNDGEAVRGWRGSSTSLLRRSRRSVWC